MNYKSKIRVRENANLLMHYYDGNKLKAILRALEGVKVCFFTIIHILKMKK